MLKRDDRNPKDQNHQKNPSEKGEEINFQEVGATKALQV